MRKSGFGTYPSGYTFPWTEKIAEESIDELDLDLELELELELCLFLWCCLSAASEKMLKRPREMNRSSNHEARLLLAISRSLRLEVE